MSNNDRRSLVAKVLQLAELIAQVRPGKLHFESEEQFLTMLSLNLMVPVRVPVRDEQRRL